MKILGTLDVPDDLVRYGRFQVQSDAGIETVEIRELSLGCSITDLERRMARFTPPPETELAIYSEERPIEFWRNIPGFREGDQVGRR